VLFSRRDYYVMLSPCPVIPRCSVIDDIQIAIDYTSELYNIHIYLIRPFPSCNDIVPTSHTTFQSPPYLQSASPLHTRPTSTSCYLRIPRLLYASHAVLRTNQHTCRAVPVSQTSYPGTACQDAGNACTCCARGGLEVWPATGLNAPNVVVQEHDSRILIRFAAMWDNGKVL
jgi:hypothetical protein